MRCDDNHPDPFSTTDLHDGVEELPARERVETCHRLIEDEELGSFGDRQRQRDLGPLTAGELTRPSESGKGQAPRPAKRRELRCSSSGTSLPPVPERARRSSGSGAARMVLRDEAKLRPSTTLAPRASVSVRTPRRRRPVGSTSPITMCRSVVLPAPFGPTSAVTIGTLGS